jgi:hypothetical protein
LPKRFASLFFSWLCFACGPAACGTCVACVLQAAVFDSSVFFCFPMYAVNAAVSVCSAVSHVPCAAAMHGMRARHGRCCVQFSLGLGIENTIRSRRLG